jgi:carotenoid cleavage dioxygenase-like enzyme
VRNGPGQFEVNGHSYRHWFDGLAMLRSFTFNDGTVSFANRYLRTAAYYDDNRSGTISYRGFAVDPCMTLFQRAMAIFNPPTLGANTVVNTRQAQDRFIAMTEAPLAVEFDPVTLETLGDHAYLEDARQMAASTATAHPHYDFQRETGYNYMLKFGPQMTYRVYAIHNEQHRLLARLPVSDPTYMHSFGMSANYVILSEYPLRMPYKNLLPLVTAQRPFIENFTWRPDDPARFYVIHKDTGEISAEITADPFFAFHHINAYEQGDELLLDITCYDDASVIDGLYLDQLRSGDYAVQTGEFRRYRLPITRHNAHASYEVITDESIELPRIHYRPYAGHDYSVAYGLGLYKGLRDFPNQLLKVHVRTGQTQTWYQEGCYPSEPVYVPAPGAEDAEADGLILSVVLDTARGHSFLLVLDAATFDDVARAEVPHHLPFDFHGQFYTSH